MLFLSSETEKHCVYVHRLVANAFLTKKQLEECVNHKNEIKTDNNVENLEWCTYKYNNEYNDGMNAFKKPIGQYKDNELLKIWSCARDAYRELGIEYKNISACCRGLRKSAGGYNWKFERKEVV